MTKVLSEEDQERAIELGVQMYNTIAKSDLDNPTVTHAVQVLLSLLFTDFETADDGGFCDVEMLHDRVVKQAQYFYENPMPAEVRAILAQTNGEGLDEEP